MSAPFGKPALHTVDAPSLSNEDAEQSVVSTLARHGAKDPAAAATLILQQQIDPDLFVNPDIRAAFVAVADLVSAGIPPTLATLRSLPSNKSALLELENILSSSVSAPANIGIYVKILKRCQRNRTIAQSRAWLKRAMDEGRPATEIRTILDDIEALERPEKRPSTFQNLSTLLHTPLAENWLIKGFFAADSTNVIFGESGSCKTFVTIDLLCHIAAGIPWLGNPVKQGKVLYIAGEGQNGIIRRFKAWFEAHPGHEAAIANIEVRTIPAALCDPDSTAILVQEIADMPDKPRAIAVDTLARNFGPGDENATRDMNLFVAGLDTLRAVTQAAIIVPHHSGHGEKNRGRGSSVLKAAIDGEFQVERQEVLGQKSEIIRMRCSKMKDSEPPPAQAWKLTQQPLPWCDEDGTFMNSAVLVPVMDGEAVQSGTFYQKQSLTPAHRIALDALRNALMQHGVEADGVVAVAEDQWRQATYSAGISSSDKPRSIRQAFQRARQELVAAKQVSTFDGRYWLPGTKRYKEEQCTHLYPGIEDGGAVQSGTSPFRGCTDVPPPADTQTVSEPTNADLIKSPLATRMQEFLADDPAGMAQEALINTSSGKAGPALAQATIHALLLAGKINRINGRLVLAGVLS